MILLFPGFEQGCGWESGKRENDRVNDICLLHSGIGYLNDRTRPGHAHHDPETGEWVAFPYLLKDGWK